MAIFVFLWHRNILQSNLVRRMYTWYWRLGTMVLSMGKDCSQILHGRPWIVQNHVRHAQPTRHTQHRPRLAHHLQREAGMATLVGNAQHDTVGRRHSIPTSKRWNWHGQHCIFYEIICLHLPTTVCADRIRLLLLYIHTIVHVLVFLCDLNENSIMLIK